jgi:subtilisin family serine protease
VLASNDIIYTSSAGNAGQKHYQGDYYNIPLSTQHDFSRGGTIWHYLYLNMQAGGSVRIVLQWNDQFGSSGNDYDLGLYSYGSNSYVAGSAATQDGNDDPLEFISYTVPGGTATGNYAIVVDKCSGAGKTLEVFIYPGSGCSVYSDNINATDSIFGHAAVPGAIAVGAIDASDPGNDDIEPFSSLGPVTISYPSPVSRAKPDICGIDGVTVTGAGSFPSTCYGTSAAAPHIAAIAAQLWSAFPNSTGDEIRTMLNDSAVDLGSAGYDNIYGYGRADALDAFEAGPPTSLPMWRHLRERDRLVA